MAPDPVHTSSVPARPGWGVTPRVTVRSVRTERDAPLVSTVDADSAVTTSAETP
jgi:hypothetical protein